MNLTQEQTESLQRAAIAAADFMEKMRRAFQRFADWASRFIKSRALLDALAACGYKVPRRLTRKLYPLQVNGEVRYFRTRARLIKFQRRFC